MCDRLSALHDPHDSSLRFEVTVSSDSLVGLLVLGFGLFGLNLVDLDAVLGMREAEVHVEGIANIDVFAFGGLAEDAVAGAGQRL